MISKNYFFLFLILTILITQIVTRFWPRHAPKIGNFQPHHYMIGLALIALYFLIPKLTILAIGAGLVVDEIPLFFIFKTWNWPDNHWKQYHSWESILGIIAIAIVMYFAASFLPIMVKKL